MSPASLSEAKDSPAGGVTLAEMEDCATSPLPRLAQPDEEPAPAGCEASLCSAGRAESSDPLLPEAQRRWAARPLPQRLQVFRRARHWMAEHPETFAHAIAPTLRRAKADTLTSELLPLLEAIRFLERRATGLLAPQRLGRRGRPLWLAGVDTEVHRDPLGHVLVIGPANFPLFLPGVQAVQALVAGNAVTWKPGAGGEPVARLLAHVLREAGLPRGVLHVTDESVEAARAALARTPDKVVFTGSLQTGRELLRELADSVTPSVMELSGADAVVVLPSADLSLVAKAVAFGLRLNGAEVCMSPRRLVATRETLHALRPLLQVELGKMEAAPLKPAIASKLQHLLSQAVAGGAVVHSLANSSVFLLEHATPAMAITRADIFAPVLSLLEAPSVLHLADIVNNNPYALTAAIFGEPGAASTLAGELRVGTVLINDLIAPTADPRVAFGGRGHSGFGLTRGAEGLLAMTASRTVLRRRKGVTRHYDPLDARHLPFFTSLLGVLHGGSLNVRWRALQRLIAAARTQPR